MQVVVEVRKDNRVWVNDLPASAVHASYNDAKAHLHSMLMRYGVSIAVIAAPTKKRKTKWSYRLLNGETGEIEASSRKFARELLLRIINHGSRLPRGTKLERLNGDAEGL